MPTIMPDRLHLDGQVYTVDANPLRPWLASLPQQPELPISPFSLKGYVVTWAIVKGTLCLLAVSAAPLARLFADQTALVPAVWFSDLLHGWCGRRRDTGYPPRRFYVDEIVLKIVSGIVARAWVLDLRALPRQTDDALRQALPHFLWPARLRGG